MDIAEKVAEKLWDGRKPPEHCRWNTLDKPTRDRLAAEARLYIETFKELSEVSGSTFTMSGLTRTKAGLATFVYSAESATPSAAIATFWVRGGPDMAARFIGSATNTEVEG